MIDWDQRKRQANLRKHDFADADEIFDGITFTYEDDRVAYSERRFVTLGSLRGAVVSIIHTEKDDYIRIISMRKATKRECEIYFQNISN